MNICLVSANDVMWRYVKEHFASPGNIDFAAEDLMCLFIYETMFTIGESRAISHADDTEQQEQQVAGNPRFSAETPLKNADQKINRERRTR